MSPFVKGCPSPLREEGCSIKISPSLGDDDYTAIRRFAGLVRRAVLVGFGGGGLVLPLSLNLDGDAGDFRRNVAAHRLGAILGQLLVVVVVGDGIGVAGDRDLLRLFLPPLGHEAVEHLARPRGQVRGIDLEVHVGGERGGRLPLAFHRRLRAVGRSDRGVVNENRRIQLIRAKDRRRHVLETLSSEGNDNLFRTARRRARRGFRARVCRGAGPE